MNTRSENVLLSSSKHHYSFKTQAKTGLVKVSLACSFDHVIPEKIEIKYVIETESLFYKSNRIIQITQGKPQCGNTPWVFIFGAF